MERIKKVVCLEEPILEPIKPKKYTRYCRKCTKLLTQNYYFHCPGCIPDGHFFNDPKQDGYSVNIRGFISFG